MNPQQLYQSIQKYVQDEARKIANDVYQTQGTRFGVAMVPNHTHTGTDTNRINAKDLIPGQKYVTGLVITGNGTSSIGGLYNPSRILFQGYAQNNASGGAATKWAILNGEMNFGQAFEFTDLTPPLVATTSGAGASYSQSCNYMFIDSAAIANTTVGGHEGAGNSSTAYLAYAADSAAAVFASIKVTSYDNKTGTLAFTYATGTNVKITGSFIIM